MSRSNEIIEILFYKNDRKHGRSANFAVHVRTRRAGRKNHQLRDAGDSTTLS